MSDHTHITSHPSCVYGKHMERLAPVCVQRIRPFGGGGLMVWGGRCGHVKTRIVVLQGNLNARRYRDEILQPVMVLFLQT